MSEKFTFDDFLQFIEEDSKHLVSKRQGLDDDVEKFTYARVTKLMEKITEDEQKELIRLLHKMAL